MTPIPAAPHLAKDRLDAGLLTNDPAMVDFMADDVGLGQPELLRITRAVTQHRFDLRGSVVKVNVVDGEVPAARSGYSELLIADDAATTSTQLVGPDGVAVTVVPTGWNEIDHMAVRLAVPDLGAAQRYFAEALRWRVDGTTVQLGASKIWLDVGDSAPADVAPATSGWTYLTVQIHDCDHETATAVAGGARVVRPPKTHGEVARFSMVADPFGNQIELSQRASLTGPLPPNDSAKE